MSFETYLKNKKEVDFPEVYEMSSLRKQRTTLPVNIYVDDTGAWMDVEHNLYRIKFQGTKSNNTDLSNLIPMSVSSNPQILISNPKHELSAKEIKQISEFIIQFENELKKLAKPSENYDFDDFIEELKRAGIYQK
jgi:hypothetical protein